MDADDSRTVSHKELDEAYEQHRRRADTAGLHYMSKENFVNNYLTREMAKLRKEHLEARRARDLKPITDRLDRIIELLEGK